VVCHNESETQEYAQSAARSAGAQVTHYQKIESLASTNNLRLKIPFFNDDQLGVAADYGPIGMNTILNFCEELHALLAEKAPGEVCLWCWRPKTTFANATLLIGAYLMLRCGWKACDVLGWIIGPDAKHNAVHSPSTVSPVSFGRIPISELKFPLPWRKVPIWTKDCLSVEDCFEGIEAALSRGWVQKAGFNVPRLRQIMLSYDAVPIFRISVVPDNQDAKEAALEGEGRRHVDFWVAADPVTTVEDPSSREPPPGFDEVNPSPGLKSAMSSNASEKSVNLVVECLEGSQTMTRMVSGESRISKATSRQGDGVGSASMGQVVQKVRPSVVNDHAEYAVTVTIPMQVVYQSSRTVGSFASYASRGSFTEALDRARLGVMSRHGRRRPTLEKTKALGEKAAERPKDLQVFARWLKDDLRCCLIARANHQDESGLPPGGSYADFFERSGFHQLNVPFPDGTAPPDFLVRQVLKDIDAELRDQVISGWPSSGSKSMLIHCKAGFGRSMCLLGALAVRLNPGLTSSAYFGWARLMRPGSIQTADQERFLRSLDEDSRPSCCCRFV